MNQGNQLENLSTDIACIYTEQILQERCKKLMEIKSSLPEMISKTSNKKFNMIFNEIFDARSEIEPIFKSQDSEYINIFIQIILICKKPKLNFMIEQWNFLYKKTIVSSLFPNLRFYMKVIESTIHSLPLWEIHKFTINVSDFVLSYKISSKTSADVGNMKELHLPTIYDNTKKIILKSTLIFMNFSEINKIIHDSASKQINNLADSTSNEIYGIKIDETHFSNTLDKSRFYKIRTFDNQNESKTPIQNLNKTGESIKPFKESKRKLRHPSMDVDLLNKIDLLKQTNELEENRAKKDSLDQSGKIQFSLKWKNQEILLNDVGSPFYFENSINSTLNELANFVNKLN